VTIALTAAGSIAVLAVLLPEGSRWIAVVVAFAAGIALERYRHSFAPAPPSLHETPEAWRYLLRYEVGVGQLAIAAVLLGAAAAVLFISFDSGEEPPAVTSASPPAAGPAPDLDVKREQADRQFNVAGARFAVVTNPAGAETAKAEIAARGERPVYLVVEITNRSRADFNPVELDFRLRDGDGGLYAPTRSTAAGSDALVTTGKLPRGDRVEQQLLYAVPREASDLVLEFEPVPQGAKQLRVPID
jgi:hypothetical protein